MLKNLQKTKDQKGFTIIEVLIVLAIAGLILLIVFLAVPALQRNSRDTSRKNDVSRILGATQEVVNNNGGDLTKLTTANLKAAVGTMGYYDPTNVTVGAKLTADTTSTNTDDVTVYPSSTCKDAQTAKGGTSRQIAVLYAVESGGGTSQCTSS
ncbi:MAG TPA: type II secretion system protein [Candidatus Saccharimonadales bacterium]|nr:type II secretion system protein [Candidatus Saccharimonadales bacterium]